MQIKYLDGDVVEIIEHKDVHVVTINGKLWTTIDSEFVEILVGYLEQAKPWVRDNGDGSQTLEFPDNQLDRECYIDALHNRRAGGWSGD